MFILPKVFKKVLASLLVVSVLFSILAKPALAAGTWYDGDFTDWHKKVYSGNEKDLFGERYTRAQVQWVVYSMFTNLIGIIPAGNLWLNCFENHPTLAGVFDPAGSILNSASECIKIPEFYAQQQLQSWWIISSNTTKGETLVSQIFKERPISAITYFNDIQRNLHIIPVANAQTPTGFGFNALNPVLTLWKGVRNATYGLFVIIIVTLAFMIMFKVKLNPQTSITIQSAIPRIIIALILVTFSYAIAGLLIDVMYLFIGLISAVLVPVTKVSPIVMFNTLTTGPSGLGLFGYLVTYYIHFIPVAFFIVVGGDSIFIKLGMVIFGILFITVGIIVLLFIGIKITWMLFKALANVLLSTIFAPLQIVLGVVAPNMGFGIWLRSYIANLATFPVAGLLLYLSILFLDAALTSMLGSVVVAKAIFGIVPGADLFIGLADNTGWPPLLGTGNATNALIFLGTSFVMLTIVPKTVELIQALIKGGQFNYGAGLDEATNPLGVRSMGQQAGQGWIINQIYNPKTDTGMIKDLISRVQSGPSGRTSAGAGPSRLSG